MIGAPVVFQRCSTPAYVAKASRALRTRAMLEGLLAIMRRSDESASSSSHFLVLSCWWSEASMPPPAA